MPLVENANARRQHLTVDAGNPVIRIEVLDHAYRLVAAGYGRIDETLLTGLYTVSYSAADARSERGVVLLPDKPAALLEPPELNFASPAPLDLTRTSHEHHQTFAKHLSQQDSLDLGHGAHMFLFVRDVSPGGEGQPADGLTLHSLSGEEIADFAERARVGDDQAKALCAGRNLSLTPGSYRLRLAVDAQQSVETIVHLVPGWQTQIFLLRGGGSLSVGGRTLPDLSGATRLMTRPQSGFEPSRRVSRPSHPLEPAEDLRLAELARHALVDARTDLPRLELNALLNSKWFDPLLGIFSLHLLLLRSECDLTLAEDILKRLRSIVGDFCHPDIEALAIEIACRKGEQPDQPVYTAPPMLRRGWDILVRHSALAPNVIAPGSLLDAIAERLWGSGAWLVWDAPPRSPVVIPAGSPAVNLRPTVLRSLPQDDAEEILSVPTKTRLKILDEHGDWLVLEVAGPEAIGVRGFARSTAVQPQIGKDDADGSGGTRLPPDLFSSLLKLTEKPLGAMPENLRSAASQLALQLFSQDLSALEPALDQLAQQLSQRLDQFLSGDSLEKLADDTQLSATERALLTYLVGQISLPRWSKTPNSKHPYSPETLVERLSLPASHIAAAAAGIIIKTSGIITDHDAPPYQIFENDRRHYLESPIERGSSSKQLKTAPEKMLGRGHTAVSADRELTPAVPRKAKELPLPDRRLRIYALNPSIGKSRAYGAVNETVISLPWEELGRGPIGEYLEVIDVDHASNRIYDPVDLNTPKLLAQDGWAPSEGNPEFHQQMVYAVAMKTIGHFEVALGRKTLWAPRSVVEDKENGKARNGLKYVEVPRLRIYPHALRAQNAYYNPSKVALLFSYFPASTRPGDATSHSMEFSCLSSDIIAYGTTHALLDGLQRFQEISNPDVPAFHEAFADIVALFQHFTIPELVRFQIAKARGKLDAAELLGGLAKQFGDGTQRGGPLRDYLGEEIKRLSYETTKEVRARGSILTSAVFEAFLKIVDRRTADLVRIATSGTGILVAGALHPDLVNRLADETCKAAKHVLHMCIRALDYCPAVDLTFGEFLRALITADIDLVPNDDHHYRIALVEAFRERDLIPRSVRAVSEETLAWGTMDDPRPAWLDDILKGIDLGWGRDLKRSLIFELNEKNRRKVWQHLNEAFTADPKLYRDFGLIEGVPRYDSDGHIVKRANPGETTFDVFSVRPTRRIGPNGSFHTEVILNIQQRQRMPLHAPRNPDQEKRIDTEKPEGRWFWFRGGTTLIIGAKEGLPIVRYNIIKRSDSKNRLARQRLTAAGGMFSPLRALYFSKGVGDHFGKGLGDPFAITHVDYGELRHG